MRNDSIYTYLTAEQSLALQDFICHPALTTEGLSFVGFVSLSDNKLKDLLIRLLHSEMTLKTEVVLNLYDLEDIYRQGRSDTIYIIPCHSSPPKKLEQSVYPAMLLYRDFIFERQLKHIYLGDGKFIASASKQMPDLFLINNAVLPLTNELLSVEKDITEGKTLQKNQTSPVEPFGRFHGVSWLDQRAINLSEKRKKTYELNKRLSSPSLHTRIFTYIQLATLSIFVQEPEKAAFHLKMAQEIAAQIDNRSFIRAIRLQEAFLYLNTAEWEKAQTLLRQFIADTDAGDSIEQLFAACNTLGYTLIRLKRMEEAFKQFTEVLENSRKAGIRNMEACALLYLGDIYNHRLDHRLARIHYRKALAIYTSRRSVPQFAHCLIRLGYSFLNTDDYCFARDYFRQALSLYKSQHLRHGQGAALYGLGESYKEAERNEKTYVTSLEKARNLFLSEQDPLALARIDQSLGGYHLSRRHLFEAENAFRSARQTLRATGSPHPEAEISIDAAWADLYILEKEYPKAEWYLQKAFDYFSQAGDKKHAMAVYAQLGNLYLSYAPHDSDRPLAYLRKALSMARQYNSLSTQWTVRQALYTFYLRHGQEEEALKQQSQAVRIRQILE